MINWFIDHLTEAWTEHLYYLTSQFTEQGFKKTENVEHNVVLLLFWFMLDNL